MRLWFTAFSYDQMGESTDHGLTRDPVDIGDLETEFDAVLTQIRTEQPAPAVFEIRVRVAP
jgi:hypothetical protein